jgi:hypothetical protein
MTTLRKQLTNKSTDQLIPIHSHYHDISCYYETGVFTNMLWKAHLSLKSQASFSNKATDIFVFPKTSRPDMGLTQPPLQWVSPVLSPGVKRPECDVDQSTLSSAETKIEPCIAYIFKSPPLDRDGSGDAGLLAIEPPDAAASPVTYY